MFSLFLVVAVPSYIISMGTAVSCYLLEHARLPRAARSTNSTVWDRHDCHFTARMPYADVVIFRKAAKKGQLVVMSSVAGIRCYATGPVYCATKWASLQSATPPPARGSARGHDRAVAGGGVGGVVVVRDRDRAMRQPAALCFC